MNEKWRWNKKVIIKKDYTEMKLILYSLRSEKDEFLHSKKIKLKSIDKK